MNLDEFPEQLTIDDVADMLGVHKNTVRAMREKGELPPTIDPVQVPAGKRWRPHWDRAAVAKLLPSAVPGE